MGVLELALLNRLTIAMERIADRVAPKGGELAIRGAGIGGSALPDTSGLPLGTMHESSEGGRFVIGETGWIKIVLPME